MNVRMPDNISDEFLSVQDEYLQEEIAEKILPMQKSLSQ